jgi:hypothetical protein
MLQSRNRLLGLCPVPVLLAALDGWLTLKGQPRAYWAGDRSQVIEGTPGFYILLTHGPAAYIAGLAAWVLDFVGMILLLPPTPALAVCLGFTLGHAIGAFSWMVDYPNGLQLHLAMIVVAAVGLAVGIRRGWRCEPRDDAPMGARLPVTLRWAMVVAMCGVVASYLWPRQL